MPEGPEIRRQADRLHRVLAGRPVRSIHVARSELQTAAAGLVGRTVESVTARGKAMLTTFDDARVVYTHNQLYGRWKIQRSSSPVPNTRRSLRWMVENESHRTLLYSASTIEILLEGELDHHPFLSRLGPDPLDPHVDSQVLLAQVRAPRFARRNLGGLLLDQNFVAGIGNYLRSEILFVGRLAPDRTPGSLTATESRQLAKAIASVCQRSYETGGITQDPRRAARLKRSGFRRSQYRHWVFSRATQPCPRCGTSIEKREVAGRRLYLCPRCQGSSD